MGKQLKCANNHNPALCRTLIIYGRVIQGKLKLLLKDAELFPPKLSPLANDIILGQTQDHVLGTRSCELTFIMFRLKCNHNSDVPGLMLTLESYSHIFLTYINITQKPKENTLMT